MSGHRGKVDITASVNIDATLPTSLLAHIMEPLLYIIHQAACQEHSVELGTLHIHEAPITKHLLGATYYSCDPGQVGFRACKMGWMVTLHTCLTEHASARGADTAETGDNLGELKEIMLIKKKANRKKL